MAALSAAILLLGFLAGATFWFVGLRSAEDATGKRVSGVVEMPARPRVPLITYQVVTEADASLYWVRATRHTSIAAGQVPLVADETYRIGPRTHVFVGTERVGPNVLEAERQIPRAVTATSAHGVHFAVTALLAEFDIVPEPIFDPEQLPDGVGGVPPEAIVRIAEWTTETVPQAPTPD